MADRSATPGAAATILRNSFLERAAVSPFNGLRAPSETLHNLRSGSADHVQRTLDRARLIMSGTVTLLGHEISLADPVRWHTEPVTGLEIPLRHWTRIDHLDPEVAGEYKVLWELNRHQYLLSLGQAYALTGDEEYVRTLIGHVSIWMDDNPPGWGINWSSSLELAYRCIAWIWCLSLVRDSPLVADAFLVRCLKFLALQGRHIERHLSTYFSPNTHLTGEALGLLYLGVFLPELAAADRWRRTGLRILREQLPLQVRPDGGYFEQASAYHGYTADIYLHADILATHLGTPFSAEHRSRIALSLQHLKCLVRPDGMIPLWGDDDGGRLLPLTPRAPSDFSDTLCTGAYQFGLGDLLASASHPEPESVLLLGTEILEEELTIPSRSDTSSSFGDTGVFVLRDGWGADSSYVMVSAGPHGSLGGGHAHADALSLEVSLRGTPLIIDPGTGTYRRDSELRKHLRSASAHNSVVVDDTPFAIPAGPFSWRTSGNAQAQHSFSRRDFGFFRGVLDHPAADARRGEPVRHIRTLFFSHSGYLVVWDRLEADVAHSVDLGFQLAPEWAVECTGHRARCQASDHEAVTFSFFGPPGGRLDVFEATVSPGYGVQQAAQRLRWRQEAEGAQDVVTVIGPEAIGRSVTRLTTRGASIGLSITGEGFRDALYLDHRGVSSVDGDTGTPAVRIEGEAALVCVRRTPPSVEPRITALLAQRLLVGGQTVLDSDHIVECTEHVVDQAP